MNDITGYYAYIANLVNSGWFVKIPKENILKYIPTHEMGHATMYTLFDKIALKNGYKRGTKEWDDFRDSLFFQITNYIIANVDHKYYSGYVNSIDPVIDRYRYRKELFAEAFTSYYLGANNELAKAYKELEEKYLNDKITK